MRARRCYTRRPIRTPPPGGPAITHGACYLVRYGLLPRLGRFAAPDETGRLGRGDRVVLRGPRGTELGEVLATDSSDQVLDHTILRPASPADLHLAEQLAKSRPDHLDRCRRVFDDGEWPLALIDVEPLLDDRRTVAYYLGPHGLDDEGLREALRSATGLDVRLEPAGLDAPPDQLDPAPPSCGSGGCGSCGDASGCAGCPVAGRSRR